MTYPDARTAVAALAGRTATLEDLREIVTQFPQLRPVVAAYPETDAPLLDWLAALHDPLVDAQLASRGGGTAGPSVASDAGPTPHPEPVADTITTSSVGLGLITGVPGGSSPTTPPGGSASTSPWSEPVTAGSGSAPIPGSTGGAGALGAASLPGGPTGMAPVPSGYPPVTPPSGASYYPSAAPGWNSGVTPPSNQPAMPLHPAAPEPPQRKRAGWPLVVGLVVLLGLIVGGVAAAFATGLIGGSSKQTATKPAATKSAPPAASASATPAGSASASTSAEPTSAASENLYVCWDGTESEISDACRLPADKKSYWAYLKYAFPSIASHPDCVQADSTGKSDYVGITVMWECELGDAMIRYRYWEEPGDAEGHYAKKFNSASTLKSYDVLIGGQPAEGWVKVDKDTVKGPDGIQRVVVTMYLPNDQLSVSVEGNDTKAMWAAFDQVRIRPENQLDGHAATDEPVEAPITASGR